jgi:hypothetical protein
MTRIRKIDTDLIILTLKKIFNIPKFATDEEITEWLRKEIARPKSEKIAEARKAYEEARKELAQCDEQHNKIH